MSPTFRPGDRLLVDLGSYRDRAPTVGEVVVLADPEARVRWLVKRISAVDPVAATVEVLGDDAEVARDSRRFGPVPLRAVVGKVYRVYYPPDRRRDL
jgi:signal peptidase I